MKAYIKVKKDRNSGLVVGHSLEMQKAMNGFNELACEIEPYYSLNDIYDQITREDIVVDYLVQCENVFRKFGITHPHVDNYPECLKEVSWKKNMERYNQFYFFRRKEMVSRLVCEH